MDSIEGLSPAISIDQKTAPRNARVQRSGRLRKFMIFTSSSQNRASALLVNAGKRLRGKRLSQIVETIAGSSGRERNYSIGFAGARQKRQSSKSFEKIKKAGLCV